MKKFESTLFGELSIKENDDFCAEVELEGNEEEVHLFIDEDIVREEKTLTRALEFFDKAIELEKYYKDKFIIEDDNGIENQFLIEYFEFFKEEAPNVFGEVDIKQITFTDMVNKLRLSGMASHNTEDGQIFGLDLTLGFDQVICVNLGSNGEYVNTTWES